MENWTPKQPFSNVPADKPHHQFVATIFGKKVLSAGVYGTCLLGIKLNGDVCSNIVCLRCPGASKNWLADLGKPTIIEHSAEARDLLY